MLRCSACVNIAETHLNTSYLDRWIDCSQIIKCVSLKCQCMYSHHICFITEKETGRHLLPYSRSSSIRSICGQLSPVPTKSCQKNHLEKTQSSFVGPKANHILIFSDQHSLIYHLAGQLSPSLLTGFIM